MNCRLNFYKEQAEMDGLALTSIVDAMKKDRASVLSK
jgi:hypothetical protein